MKVKNIKNSSDSPIS